MSESFKPMKTSTNPKSLKHSKAEFLTPLPPLKTLQGALLSSEVESLTFQPHSPKERPGLVPSEVKNIEQESTLNELTKLVQMLMDEKINTKTHEQKPESSNSGSSSKISQDVKLNSQNSGSSKSLRIKLIQKPQLKERTIGPWIMHEMYIASLKRSENYKAQPYQYAPPSKQILKAKEKPFPPCTHRGFNDHRHDDCRNYLECEIYGSYDHSTSGHNRVIHIRGGVLAESSQSSESSIGVKCNTCESAIHSTTDHNEFDHFKSGEKIQARKAREPTKK
ncbi:hypothetical protein Tco_0790127 [Tanacetum coccineum]